MRILEFKLHKKRHVELFSNFHKNQIDHTTDYASVIKQSTNWKKVYRIHSV